MLLLAALASSNQPALGGGRFQYHEPNWNAPDPNHPANRRRRKR
jgi:hypothetical protein